MHIIQINSTKNKPWFISKSFWNLHQVLIFLFCVYVFSEARYSLFISAFPPPSAVIVTR